MKYFIAFALIAAVCALAQAQEQTCQVDVQSACGQTANGEYSTQNPKEREID